MKQVSTRKDLTVIRSRDVANRKEWVECDPSMKELLKRKLPMGAQKQLVALRNEWFGGYSQKTWSQEGEDIVLSRYFGSRSTGFYVDVGAHHPKRYSNTWMLYRRGWCGINIDAMPGSMIAFRRARKRDINVECGVGEKAGHLDYYMFDDGALNSFSWELSDGRHVKNPEFRIVETRRIGVERLATILEKHLPLEQEIDFLTIDVEGMDLEVLRSNDWSRFRPELVLVEMLGSSLADLDDAPVARYLAAQNYEAYAKCVNTVFFRKVS